MNAYELADRIIDDFYLIEASKMLRQQADRITELEGELSRYELRDLEHTSRIDKAEAELAYLKCLEAWGK